jgi:hypothetical protein
MLHKGVEHPMVSYIKQRSVGDWLSWANITCRSLSTVVLGKSFSEADVGSLLVIAKATRTLPTELDSELLDVATLPEVYALSETDTKRVYLDFIAPRLHTAMLTVRPATPQPSAAIKNLYEAFNERNATKAASFLSDDCVYEDLLLGPNTVCRGKEAFAAALRFHPAFIASYLFGSLPIILPALKIVVDSVAEGVDCVGVEWHVEIGTMPFPLGRGLSQATIDKDSGRILRVVDIAEAPWRVIGLAFAPLLSVGVLLSELYLFKR